MLALFALLAGAPINAQDFSSGSETPALRVGGNVSARAVFYQASELRARREPFSWVLNGTVNVQLYGVDMPFSFTLSEQERDFAQPFNQFGVSPRYEWLTGHFGYRNVTFSPYTLAGHQMLGAGFEAQPGLLRAGFMYGRLQRAVAEDTAAGRFVQPAYERSGFAGRIGVGDGGNQFDVIFLKAKDDPASLRNTPRNALVLPGENLVLGFSGGVTLFEALRISMDAAASDYTRDVRAVELETTGNSHMEAFDGLINQRASSQFYTAVRGSAAWNARQWGMGLTYTRIDPDYQSMGAYYIGSDIQSVAIAPRVLLGNGVFRANATMTWREDNLQDKKASTTTRMLPAVSLGYQPSPVWGVDVQYTDVFTSQAAGRRSLSDSTRLDSSNPMITLTPRYTISSAAATHNFLVNLTYQTYLDNNTFTSRYSEYNSTNVHATYALALPRQHWSFSLSGNTTRMENLAGTFRNSGVSVGASKAMLEQTLRVNGTVSASFHGVGETITGSLGSTYNVQRRHTFSAQLTHVTSSAGYYAQKSFSEITAVLGYAYSF